jgi:ketosteroid isomerase-like protein
MHGAQAHGGANVRLDAADIGAVRRGLDARGNSSGRLPAGAVRVSVPVAQGLEEVVSRWVDAFNQRDLDGMLRRLDADVDFHPLRLSGLRGSYRGHDGVREWFANLKRLRHEHRIVLSEARAVAGGSVFAVGSLSLAGEPDIGPFCALHRIDDRLIAATHQYLTDPDMIERLGLIP